MTLEQLALLGIAVFAFMAVSTFFMTVRAMRQITKKTTGPRLRRTIRGQEPAMAMAVAVVEEIAGKHPQEVASSREKGELTMKLDKALDEGKEYFLNRVDSRQRFLFREAIDKIIFEKEGNEK